MKITKEKELIHNKLLDIFIQASTPAKYSHVGNNNIVIREQLMEYMGIWKSPKPEIILAIIYHERNPWLIKLYGISEKKAETIGKNIEIVFDKEIEIIIYENKQYNNFPNL